PVGVFPLMLVQPPDNRSRLRRTLRPRGIWVGLLFLISLDARANVIFVVGALRKVRQEELPDPTGSQAHGMAPAVPAVEIADHRDNLRVRGPYREAHTGHAFRFHQ